MPASRTAAPLPEPDEETRRHSEALSRIIRTAVDAAGGCIGFDDYMRLALYEPGFGYYSTGAARFDAGGTGDFTTAPEISPLFARCLARQCAQALEALPDGDILEFGAGSGALAAELLPALKAQGTTPRRYHILETSAALRARQRETLQQCVPRLIQRVDWLDSLPPEGFRGVVLANEVLDALPVKCFTLRGGAVVERGVANRPDGGFQWCERPADAALEQAVRALLRTLPGPLPDGYRSEVNLQLPVWVQSLAERLQQALVVLIDYGYTRREYYHEQRAHGTLLCHYRQRAFDDPFFYPGLTDISANVDFTALAESGRAAGLKLYGYNSQAQFLMGCGIQDAVAEADSERERFALSQQIKRLALPSEMGERFQVMVFLKELRLTLAGFGLRDHRRRL